MMRNGGDLTVTSHRGTRSVDLRLVFEPKRNVLEMCDLLNFQVVLSSECVLPFFSFMSNFVIVDT